ncbi:MAG: L,D-transpeptidase, partial [Lachnoclostridium sp.]|nr:L,D-transpeptidase [Lachnoclostridium sp.]
MRRIFLMISVAFLLIIGICSFGTNKSKAAGTYLIKINKQQCVVTIYEQDKKGRYTVPVKAMLCSPGLATPLGTFSLKEKIRWHTLDGPVYGQYCSRIVNGVLFHSVWYHVNGNPSTLSSTQYNNLGSQVSHGCVRLAVRDAKWIYDNCSSGTTVIIYNAKNPGPLGRP